MDELPAFEEKIRRLVNQYAEGLVRLAYVSVRNFSDAEDIVQEVFLTYLRKRPHHDSPEHERAWLIRVTVNKCRDHLRSAWIRRRAEMPKELPGIPPRDYELLWAVLALPERYRIPLYLYYYEDYSIGETAALMRLKPSTVGTRLERGRKLLSQRIGDEA